MSDRILFSQREKQSFPFLPLVLSAVSLFLLLCSLEFSSVNSRLDADVVSMARPADGQIGNFDYVHPYLARGSYPTPWGMLWLQRNKFTTIVDLREAGTPPVVNEAITARKMGFTYLNLSTRNMPSADQLERFIQEVNGARAGRGKVFVHCNYGSDRTGFFIAAWRVVSDRWRCTQALSEMLRHGFFIHKFQESKTKELSNPDNWSPTGSKKAS